MRNFNNNKIMSYFGSTSKNGQECQMHPLGGLVVDQEINLKNDKLIIHKCTLEERESVRVALTNF